MIDPGQLRELEPYIAQAHHEHDVRSKSPFNPVRELLVAGGSTDDGDILKSIQDIRDTADKHFKGMDELGVDYRPILAASFLVNILTEDNLPHYTKTIDRVAHDSEAFSVWLNRWTSEEHEHGVLLRDYALFSGILGQKHAIIPNDVYHEGVVSQLQYGTDISITSLAQGFAYLSFQEGLTKVAHRNEQFLLDPTGRRVVKRVAADEAGHESVYAYLQSAMFKLFPDETLIATNHARRRFHMPGAIGIPKFKELAEIIARAGIFDAEMTKKVQDEHLQGEQWDIASIVPVSEEAKKAKASLLSENKVLIKLQKMTESAQDKVIAEAKLNGTILPFVLGKTVEIDKATKILVPIAA